MTQVNRFAVSAPNQKPAAHRCVLRLPPMAATEVKPAIMLDGRPVADKIKKEVAEEVSGLNAKHGFRPCLAAVLVGENDASAVYVQNKIRTCAEVGFRSEQFNLPAFTTTKEMLGLLDELNANEEIDGILVQLPLPDQIDEAAVIEG